MAGEIVDLRNNARNHILKAARWLKVDAPVIPKRFYPVEYTPVGGFKSELKELTIPPDSPIVGQAIVELGLPADFLIILVATEKDFIQPSGQTVLQVGDTLLVLSDKKSFEEVQPMITANPEEDDRENPQKGRGMKGQV